MKKIDTTTLLLLALVVGGGIYLYMSSNQVKPPQIPQGYNTQYNLNGVPVWVNAANQAVNSLGQVIGDINAIIQAIKDGKPVPGVGGIGCGCNMRSGIRQNQICVL